MSHRAITFSKLCETSPEHLMGITTVAQWHDSKDQRVHPIYNHFFVVVTFHYLDGGTHADGDKLTTAFMEGRCTVAIVEDARLAEIIYSAKRLQFRA